MKRRQTTGPTSVPRHVTTAGTTLTIQTVNLLSGLATAIVTHLFSTPTAATLVSGPVSLHLTISSMRAVFVVLLAFVAVGLLAPKVTAQPPPPPPHHNGSHIAFFNDSDCTHHIHSVELPLPSSTQCVPEHFHHHNASATFQCDTADNKTALSFVAYNNTAGCDNAPVLSWQSNAAAQTCAPITVTFEGSTSTLYGHIRCEGERASTLDAAVRVARQLIATRQRSALSSIADMLKASKAFNTRLFA